jgi:Orsellinic acid/F9775 biosynthesis cluster protein D
MDHFIHLPEFRVIVCKKCQYAVLPSQIESHFTPERPHGFTKEERVKITREVAKVDGLIWDTDALKGHQFPFPADTAEPIMALQAPKTNGLRCSFEVDKGESCPYVCRLRQQMQDHVWQEHK